jgi:uncharacterized membrane protein
VRESAVQFTRQGEPYPVHQMLIVFPLGCWTISVVFAIVYLVTDYAYLSLVVYRMPVAGIVSGLVAAPLGAKITASTSSEWAGQSL